jgi:hypothetical protein
VISVNKYRIEGAVELLTHCGVSRTPRHETKTLSEALTRLSVLSGYLEALTPSLSRRPPPL